MNLDIMTREDLKVFKEELLTELLPADSREKQHEWLKSSEVRKLLKISPATLQNLRVNGTLKYTRIGSIVYYKAEDIYAILEGGRKK
jgi:hypothetical protein